MKISRVGVDLTKNVFQVHGVDKKDKTVWKPRLTRKSWIQVLINHIEPGCEIGMQACGGAHHLCHLSFDKMIRSSMVRWPN